MIKNKNSILRPPIITIIGHIDHGKTTLLNYIRKINKIEKEHSGITQYIKPYSVKHENEIMTFLDTPGHFAFNSIRKKSISYSDLSILLISIDDGIQEQTIEAINIAKSFNIPLIIAISKVDKSLDVEKDGDKILTQLMKYDLVPEKWGGDTLISYISSKTGNGIDNLINLIKLQSEMLNLISNKNEKCTGVILDCKIEIGKGTVTTIIVLNGTLKKGDIIKVNNISSKIKSIMDENYNEIKNSELSIPLYVTGLSNNMEIGEKFIQIDEFINQNTINLKKENNKNNDINLLFENIKNTKKKINIIIKADVQGSVSVLNDNLSKEITDKVILNIIKNEIGNINESDINLAHTTNSIILGFNVKYDNKIKKLSDNLLVKINIFYVIYDLISYIKNLIENKILEDIKDNIYGTATVKKIFKQDNNIIIAGCFINSGKIKQNSKIKIYRKNILIHQGQIDSIKIFQKIVNEIKSGNECGIIIKNYNTIQINDKIEAFET